MAKFNALAPDSAGFKVLQRLHLLGGRASIKQLMEALWSDFRSAPRFHQVAAKPLVDRGLVRLSGAAGKQSLEISPEGRLLVERYESLLPKPRPVVTAAKPLNASRLAWGQNRAGALDYRGAPSIMGGERVPYHNVDEETPA